MAAALVLEVEQRLAAAFDEGEQRSLEQQIARMSLLREQLGSRPRTGH